jgi:[ribosomal protein S18]-alanine N-acetyltransferase
VNLRPATLADIPIIMDLERTCATAAHWTENRYRQAVQPGQDYPPRLVLVVKASADSGAADGLSPERDLLGFLVARRAVSDWELENIVVAPAARRNGLGRRLMNALLSAACDTNSESVFLEVRESNVPARNLYQEMGFEQTGRRKLYYTDPIEDAILYRRKVE